MLLKAQPIIDAIRLATKDIKGERTCVRLLWPARAVFEQEDAHSMVETYTHCVLICGRYEGIDHRVELRCENTFGVDFSRLSLWKFVTLGWEIPAMTFIEATARLIPWVIKEETSWQDESYRPELWWINIEYPQYTRPEIVEGMQVPEILFSGHHANIAERRKEKMW
jgi:tRNA (guanine37-N1)-methyltransferase